MSLATASVDIIADTSRFKEDLRRKLEQDCSSDALEKCLSKVRGDKAGQKIGRDFSANFDKAMANCNASKAVDDCLNKAGASSGKAGAKVGRDFKSSFAKALASSDSGSIARSMSKDLMQATSGAVSLRGALVALGTTAPAVIAPLVAGAGAVAGGFTAAAAGVGAWAGVIGPAVSNVLDVRQKMADLDERIAKADTTKEKNQLLREQKRLYDGLSSPQQKFLGEVNKTANAYRNLQKATEAKGLGALAPWLKTGRELMGQGAPIVDAFSDSIKTLGQEANTASKSAFWQGVQKWIKDAGPDRFESIGRAAGNMAKGVVGAIKALDDQFGDDVFGGLENMAKDFATWGENLGNSPGFQKFVGFVRENWPKVQTAIGGITDLAGNIATALAPLAGPALDGLNTVLKGINDFATENPGAFKTAAVGVLALAGGIKATKLAVAGFKGVKGVLSFIKGLKGLKKGGDIVTGLKDTAGTLENISDTVDNLSKWAGLPKDFLGGILRGIGDGIGGAISDWFKGGEDVEVHPVIVCGDCADQFKACLEDVEVTPKINCSGLGAALNACFTGDDGVTIVPQIDCSGFGSVIADCIGDIQISPSINCPTGCDVTTTYSSSGAPGCPSGDNCEIRVRYVAGDAPACPTKQCQIDVSYNLVGSSPACPDNGCQIDVSWNIPAFDCPTIGCGVDAVWGIPAFDCPTIECNATVNLTTEGSSGGGVSGFIKNVSDQLYADTDTLGSAINKVFSGDFSGAAESFASNYVSGIQRFFSGSGGAGNIPLTATFTNVVCPPINCAGTALFTAAVCPPLNCAGTALFTAAVCPPLNCGGTAIFTAAVCPPLNCSGTAIFTRAVCPPLNCSGTAIFSRAVCPPLNCNGTMRVTSAVMATKVPDQSARVNYTLGTQAPPQPKSTQVNYTLGSQANPQPRSTTVNYTLGSQAAPQAMSATVNYTRGSQEAPAAAANGDYVTSAQYRLVGEAGPEVIIPLTRPARARELAQQSGLMSLLTGLRSSGSAVASSVAEKVQTIINAPITVQTPAKDPETVAYKVVSRLTSVAASTSAVGLGTV
ncbi:hypothetical protein ACIBG8_54210 [Nonomuraea sp. NPDC050556]|uniref:hypothetical protein n=1 Tax=Nonomuraea sp. NPDC050556 TaxID=3364369 RepID=UPI0037B5CCD3